MDKKKAETLLYQIMSGYIRLSIGNTIYHIDSPDISQRRRAAEIFQELYEDTAYNDWMTDMQNKRLLVSMEYVSPDVDKNFKEIETRIEDLKVELYDSLFNSDHREKTRTILSKVKEKHSEMIANRHRFDAMTREGYADLIKSQYVIAMTLKTSDGKRVISDDGLNSAPFSLLDKVTHKLAQHVLTEMQVRYLARMDMWRGYWSIGKVSGSPFGKPAIELTDDQRLLCQITKMYDSAYEHPNCPSDEVLKDDDAFDGWMIKERRKNEKDRGENAVDDITKGKHENADEVYLMAGSPEDAKRIESLNDTRAKAIKKQRAAAMKAKGVVYEAEMPDQQTRIQTEMNRLFTESVRAGKHKG